MQNRPLPVGSGRFYNLHAATNQAVGAGFYPSRAECKNKYARRTATTQNPRRGRCPHRPGRMQSQNCNHHQRKRKTFCRGGRLCPPVGATANLPQRAVKNVTSPYANLVAIAIYQNHTIFRVRRVGRARHRPLQTWCGFAEVHSFLQVRAAGRTGSSAPKGACGFALLSRRYD